MPDEFKPDLARRQRVKPVERRRRAEPFEGEDRREMFDTGKLEKVIRAAGNVAREEGSKAQGVVHGAVDKVLDKVHRPEFVTGFLAVGVVCFMAYRDLVTMEDLTDAIDANTAAMQSIALQVREAGDSVREGNLIVAELDHELAKVNEIDSQMDSLGGVLWRHRQLLTDMERLLGGLGARPLSSPYGRAGPPPPGQYAPHTAQFYDGPQRAQPKR